MRNFARLLLCCLFVFPVAAQRGGGMRGGFGGVRGGFGSGFRHGGFVGSGFGGFGGFRFGGPGFFPHRGFFPQHGFFPRHRFFFGAGFGFFPFAYPVYTPIYPYPNYGYGYPSSDYGYGYSPSPPVVIYQPEAAPPPAEYYAPATARSEVREYPETSSSQKYETPIYLIAFKNQKNIHAAQAYWAEGDTLHYITLQHEHQQAPLDSVDRAFTYRLNRERHVDFRLRE